MGWLDTLKDYSEQHQIVVLRFDSDEWESLTNSRRGVGEFTIALPHDLVGGVKAPAPCLLLVKAADTEQVVEESNNDAGIKKQGNPLGGYFTWKYSCGCSGLKEGW